MDAVIEFLFGFLIALICISFLLGAIYIVFRITLELYEEFQKFLRYRKVRSRCK